MKTEIKTAPDPFTEHSNKSISALVKGVTVTTLAILFFSFQHLLPINTSEFSSIQKVTSIVAPLAIGILEHYRQEYLANKALVNGEKDTSKIGMV